MIGRWEGTAQGVVWAPASPSDPQGTRELALIAVSSTASTMAAVPRITLLPPTPEPHYCSVQWAILRASCGRDPSPLCLSTVSPGPACPPRPPPFLGRAELSCYSAHLANSPLLSEQSLSQFHGRHAGLPQPAPSPLAAKLVFRACIVSLSQLRLSFLGAAALSAQRLSPWPSLAYSTSAPAKEQSRTAAHHRVAIPLLTVVNKGAGLSLRGLPLGRARCPWCICFERKNAENYQYDTCLTLVCTFAGYHASN